MKKNLPKVYANPINKIINNNLDVYYNDRTTKETKKSVDVTRKINEIFASTHHVYKSNVRITSINGILETTIIGKSGNNLLSLNGEKININDIQDIEKI